MTGKTEYQDEDGRHMIYAADLAAWAADLIYGTGLTEPLPLAPGHRGRGRVAGSHAPAGGMTWSEIEQLTQKV